MSYLAIDFPFMKIKQGKEGRVMGQKDLVEKRLEDYEDVFSDIFNGLVFGEDFIKQKYLRASSTESIYQTENGIYRNQFRDVLKEYTDNCLLEIGSLGIENQSTIDKYIPVRIMGYDYVNYRSQIDRKKYPLLPVITIVLNFSDKPWNKTKSLQSIMKISNKFKPYVQDYKIMVFDIAFLEDEVIERFTSDFKLIAKFFKNKRLGNPDMFEDDEIDHVAAFMDFLAVFTGDDRYRKIKKDLMKKGGRITMCSVAQALEEKGIKKGIDQGRAIGIIETCFDNGMTEKDILCWLQKKLEITLKMAEDYMKLYENRLIN